MSERCMCQRAYDTGLTGVPRIDARLEGHYNHSVERDAIKRSYDHYHFGIPYVEWSAQPPYCFASGQRGECDMSITSYVNGIDPETGKPIWRLHTREGCDYARLRPPKIVAQMRFYIESKCEATFHYPDLELAKLGRDRDWPVYAMQLYDIGPPILHEGNDYGSVEYIRPAGRSEDSDSVKQERLDWELYEFAKLNPEQVKREKFEYRGQDSNALEDGDREKPVSYDQVAHQRAEGERQEKLEAEANALLGPAIMQVTQNIELAWATAEKKLRREYLSSLPFDPDAAHSDFWARKRRAKIARARTQAEARGKLAAFAIGQFLQNVRRNIDAHSRRSTDRSIRCPGILPVPTV